MICRIVELADQLGKRKVIPLGRKIVGKTMQGASRIWFAASKNSFGPCKAALKQPEDARKWSDFKLLLLFGRLSPQKVLGRQETSKRTKSICLAVSIWRNQVGQKRDS